MDEDLKGPQAKNLSLADNFVSRNCQNLVKIFKKAFLEHLSYVFSASIDSSQRVDNLRAQDC